MNKRPLSRPRIAIAVIAISGLACSSSSSPGTPSGDGGPGGDTGGGPDAATGDTGTGGDSARNDASPPPGDAGLGSQSFPASSIIYQDVSNATLDPNSTATISHLSGAGGWGSGNFQIDFSFTILHADSSVVPRAFTPSPGYYTPDCDMTMVPVPPGGNAEGSMDYTCDAANNDCHVLIYQGMRLYELYQTNITGGQANGSPFTTSCEVVWDLTHDYWQPGTPYSRGDQCTSTDAAGMPIAPLLVTGTELAAGVVNHAMRFTLPNPRIQKGVYLHPGTHAGGPTGDAMMPAYVARFRLKSSFDVSALPPGAKTIAVALQKYGMFLDDGGNIPLTIDSTAASMVGSHDLAPLQVTDFEIVASPDPPVTLTYNCTRTPITM